MASNRRARGLALHAARAVTLGLAVSTLGSGCFGSHEAPRPEPDRDRDPEPERADAAVALDAGRDAGPDASADAGMADAGREVCDMSEGWEAYDECCAEHMWDPAWGCFAWGPFVPPAEVA